MKTGVPNTYLSSTARSGAREGDRVPTPLAIVIAVRPGRRALPNPCHSFSRAHTRARAGLPGERPSACDLTIV